MRYRFERLGACINHLVTIYFLSLSLQIREGDEIDVVKSLSPDNPENLIISRIEMLSARVDDNEEHIIVVARRFKSLTVGNYAGANCYKSSEE